MAAAPTSTPRREVIVTGVAKARVVAIPLGANGKATERDIAENAQLTLGGNDAQLVCAAAADRATVCERIPADREFVGTLHLTAGRLVEGRCVIGRRPATRATIHVRPANVEARRPFVIPLTAGSDGQLAMHVTTNEKGLFRIEHLAAGDYRFEIVTEDGRAEETEVVSIPPIKQPTANEPVPTRLVTLPEIRLAEGVSLTVEVRASDGEAVPNAAVSISQGGGGEVRRRTFERKADTKGVARFEGIDAQLPLQIACAARGFATFSEKIDLAEPLATCVLARFATVRGQVVDVASVAVRDAWVEVVGDDRRRTATDAEGRFVVEDLPAGTYRIRASSSRTGSGTREVTVVDGEAADLGRLQVGELRTAYGRVVAAATGAPITNATIRAIDPPGGSAVSDRDGAFTIDIDPATLTIADVTAEGYARGRASIENTTAESPLTVRLERPGRLEVTAWNDDGEPCRGCTVVVAGSGEIRSALTNESGIAAVEGLTPSDYEVNRERITSTSRQVVVSGGGDTAIATVRPNATTRIELGAPTRALRVRVSPFLPPEHSLRAYSASGRTATAKAESDGTFIVRRSAAETYDLRVESRSGGVFVGRISPAFAGDHFDARLGSATIEIQLTSETTNPGALLVNIIGPSGARAAWARTDAAGVARVSYLQPGTYTALLGSRVLGTVAAQTDRPGVLRSSIDE